MIWCRGCPVISSKRELALISTALPGRDSKIANAALIASSVAATSLLVQVLNTLYLRSFGDPQDMVMVAMSARTHVPIRRRGLADAKPSRSTGRKHGNVSIFIANNASLQIDDCQGTVELQQGKFVLAVSLYGRCEDQESWIAKA